MKRVRGITLAQILRKLREGNPDAIKTYTRHRLLEIFVSICNGAAFAHSKGIIHRDLKPANIMVGDYGEVFIADWGLALYREEDDTSQAAGRISLGHLPEEKKIEGEPVRVSGTPAFMAPEQIMNQDDELDAQIDVYALGTILYSILTWEASPFEGASTITELMQNVASHKFLRPRRRAPRRRIPYELEAITLKAMHADKKKRYESVIALLSDVRNYMAKYPVSAYSPLPHYRLPALPAPGHPAPGLPQGCPDRRPVRPPPGKRRWHPGSQNSPFRLPRNIAPGRKIPVNGNLRNIISVFP